jgi:molecular chaperone GrpE (heat shock protein)
MRNLLANLFTPRSKTNAQPRAAELEHLLTLENELQSLRIDLEGREQHITSLQQEIERMRARQDQMQDDVTTSRLEALFSDLASPASQILTQAHLVEQQGKPVQAADVLAVARRFIRALERHGVNFEGQISEQVAYDPNRHTLMQQASATRPGEMVKIQFSGVVYRSKMIYKAIVES